jgi:hypothetical protein
LNNHVNPVIADILNRFAHGITRTGPAKFEGKHLSDAANEPGDLTETDLAEIDASFAPRAACSIKRESTGCGLSDSTTLVCSCGWRGRPEYQYNDHMYSNLNDQERAHLARGGK